MKKSRYTGLRLKRKISECKKRLHNLKIQGFTFSSDIYDDLDSLEKKILQQSIFGKIWKEKIPIIAGIISILLVAFTFSVFYPDPFGSTVKTDLIKPMNLSVTNLVNGTIINESTMIMGTAEQPDGEISIVQIKIDDNEWEKANGTNYWNYTLSLDTLSQGNHSFQIRCYNGEKHKTIKRFITIKKKNTKQTSVQITDPHWGDTISVPAIIKGTATAENQDIQSVKIRFNEGKWITAEGTHNWSYKWSNTNFVKDNEEVYSIEVKSVTNESESEIQKILVIVTKNKEREAKLPPFEKGEYFQWYAPPNVIPKPNQEYELKIYYRQRTVENILPSRNPITIEIQGVKNKDDYLTVSVPQKKISTIPDNNTYNYSYTVSLSEDAFNDELSIFSVVITYHTDSLPIKTLYNIIKGIDNIFPTNLLNKSFGYTVDVFIIPGRW